MNILIKHILQQLVDIQHTRTWIGSSYDSMLKGVEDDLVFVRPIPGLHSIADIISHLTLWRTEALLKVKTGKGSKTDESEENWLPEEKLRAKGWTRIKAEYDNSLPELIELLKDKEDSFLDQEYYDPDFKRHYPYSFLLNGMLHHDTYHLGQLGIIIKFLKSNTTGSE